MNISHRRSSCLAILTVVCLSLLLVVMPAPAADNTGQVCAVATIGDSFRAKYPEADKTPEQQVREIQTLLEMAGFDPVRIDGWLGGETYKALSQFCLEVDEHLGLPEQNNDETSKVDLANHLLELLTRIVDLPKEVLLSGGGVEMLANVIDQPKKILLSGGGCGCSRDFSALVYGFYPYWLADGKQHIVDFSLFERIGYFALNLNEHGHITRKLHFPADAGSFPNIAEFINRAHKYRVKVDVTFTVTGWQNWSVDNINNAVKNIFSTVTREYQIKEPSWWRKRLPLVENNSTTHVDGINLYFDRYEDSRDGKKIVAIVKELNLKLKQASFDANLNIMLGFDLAKVDRGTLNEPGQTAGKIGENFEKLVDRFRKIENQFTALEKILVSESDMVDQVFIFLSQDTSRSKKDLRQLIENAFKGEARKTVLRKMVPIVIAQGLGAQKSDGQKSESSGEDAPASTVKASDKKDSQFEEDLIYMQDNFAGIGLWHLPLTQIPEASKDGVAEKLIVTKDATEQDGSEKSASEEDATGLAGAEAAAEEKAKDAKVAKEKLAAAEVDVKNTAAMAETAKKGPDDKTKEAEKTANETEKDVADANAAAEKAQRALATARIRVKETADALEEAEKNVADAKAIEEKAAADEEKAAAEKMAMQEDVDTIRKALEGKYQRSSQFAFLGEKYEPYAIKLCEWACPNRWVFRIALDILLVLALIYALWSFADCRLREFYQRRFIWFAGFGVLIAMVFAVSAVCDPFWKKRAVFVLVGIPLSILVVWGSSRWRKMNQPLLP